MWINSITGPNTIIGFNDTEAMSLLKTDWREWYFCPIDKRLVSQIMSVDLDPEKKPKNLKHQFMLLINLWIYKFMVFHLKHKLGTTT